MIEPKSPTSLNEERGYDSLPYPSVSFHHIYRGYPIFHDHKNLYWEFFLCTLGQYRHVINGKEFNVNVGDAFLIHPNDTHAIFEKEKPNGHLNIMFSIPIFEKSCSEHSPKLLKMLNEKEILAVSLSEREIDKIYAYCKFLKEMPANGMDKDLIDSLLMDLVLETSVCQNLLNDKNKPEWLLSLLSQINTPTNQSWRVKDVLSHCNYSHTHLSRLFKKYMGCSLEAYLMRVKVQIACDYLLHSDLPIFQIASILGYQSIANFNSVFKRHINLSPSSYRKIHVTTPYQDHRL